MILFYLLVFIIAVITSVVQKDKDIFSPGRLFIILYSFLLTINSFNLCRYQTPWSPTTILLFGSSLGAFIGGYFIVVLLSKTVSGKAPTFLQIRQMLKNDAAQLDWSWMSLVALVCLSVFISVFIYDSLSLHMIPMFAKSPDEARLAFLNKFPMGYVWFFGITGLMLATEAGLFGTLSIKRKWFLFSVSIVALMLYLTLVTRVDLFRYLIFVVVLFHYGKQKIKLQHLLLVGIFAVVLFSAFFIIRAGSTPLATLAEASSLRMPKNLIFLSSFYMYITNNFWNLDFVFRKFVDSNIGFYPTSFGFELFRPIFFFNQTEGAMSAMFNFDTIFNESAMAHRGYNTIVFVWHFFKDFGVLGCLLIPLISSILLAIFYTNTIRKPTLLRIDIWAIVVGLILFSFLIPLWSFWFVYFNVGVFLLAHKKITI